MTRLLSGLLEQRALEDGGRTALQCGEASYSYAELHASVRRLASTFGRHGVGHRSRVGLLVPKSHPAYVALFAAMHVGGAYVPLDASAPVARLAGIVRDAGLVAIVGSVDLLGMLFTEQLGSSLALVVTVGEGGLSAEPPRGASVVGFEDAMREEPSSASNPAAETDLSYILYTSGSTGVPKGVMHTHRSALAFVDWAVETLGPRQDDRVAGVAELHFDLSTFDIFATVSAGGTLVPLPSRIILRPRELAKWIAAERISVWYSTPSLLVLLLTQGRLSEQDVSRLKLILFAGEVFPMRYLRELAKAIPHAELVNLYGPTESNVITWHRVDGLPEDMSFLPIGIACGSIELTVRDAAGAVVPKGVVGELWVRSPILMQGYWGDDEKTRRALVPGGNEGSTERLLRTGDRVHVDEHGVFHYHGRDDGMVKVRGYRVDLGDVESAIYAVTAVQEAAVLAVRGADEVTMLRAHVVFRETGALSAVQLKTELAKRLPAYMIPAAILVHPALPKTSSGKIDRAKLSKETD